MTEERNEYFVLDSSSLIDLLGGVHPAIKSAALRELAKRFRLRVPAAVVRELRKGSVDDPVKAWANSQAGKQATVSEFGEIPSEIARLSSAYASGFTTRHNAADPAVVATAKHFIGAGHQVTVVAGDVGIQTVCYREGIRAIPTATFRQLLGF